MAFDVLAQFLRDMFRVLKRRTRGMAHGMTRREFAVAASAAGLAAFGFGGRALGGEPQTLRLIMRNDLRVLDPMWTTAYATRNHAYMVFDTLFALDSKLQPQPQPQMVSDYSISADKLLYSFTLRNGLKFHDGQPVRGPIASLRSSAGWRATLLARPSPP